MTSSLSRWTLVALLFAAGCKRSCQETPSATTSKPSASSGAATLTHDSASTSAAKPSSIPARPPVARAEPKAAPTRTPAQTKAWGAAMKTGRAAFRAKNFVAALRALEDALKIFPDDAQTLSEIGWAAFNDKDLKRAEEATRASLNLPITTSNRGATLYNLGRIEEARDQKKKAIDAYEASLTARPNSVVLARLRSLDAARAEAFAPLAFAKANGPFGNMNDACANMQTREPGEGAAHTLCDPNKSRLESIEGSKEIKNVSAPYQSIALHSSLSTDDDVTKVDEAEHFEQRIFLAVQAGKRFFNSNELVTVNVNTPPFNEDLRVERFELIDLVPSGALEIVLAYHSTSGRAQMGTGGYGSNTASYLVGSHPLHPEMAH